MNGVEQLQRSKERILSFIQIRGPSLPVQVGRAIGSSPLFASAFLSELKAEDKIKVSDMKVGSSPLYYIGGQEALLENFVNYLNQREREAFSLLKAGKVLEDEEQTPVVRVALRAIKDFAVPLQVRVDGQMKLFWKYFLVVEEEVTGIIKNILAGKLQNEMAPQVLEKTQETAKEQTEEIKKEIPIEVEHKKKAKKKVAKTKEIKTHSFPNLVRDYLGGKDIEILEILSEKKKEFIARVRLDGVLGKQEYYLTAKDKKSISEDDLALALQRANSGKMLSLFLSTGESSAKAKEYLKEWRNFINFEKIKV
ncbi:MAG: hypothetical protein AABX73_03680 [Nanoarchaeota archaeon]